MQFSVLYNPVLKHQQDTHWTSQYKIITLIFCSETIKQLNKCEQNISVIIKEVRHTPNTEIIIIQFILSNAIDDKIGYLCKMLG